MKVLGLLFLIPVCLNPVTVHSQTKDDIEFQREAREMYQEMKDRLKQNDTLLRSAQPGEVFILKNPDQKKSPKKAEPKPETPESPPKNPPQPETPESQPQELPPAPSKAPIVI